VRFINTMLAYNVDTRSGLADVRIDHIQDASGDYRDGKLE
jgi:hypothetical protein